MLKLIFCFSALLFLGSCLSVAPKERIPAQNTQQISVRKHYIIAVHGIGGDKTTFGSMKIVLLSHLKQLRPQTEFVFLNFSYPTGKSQLNAFDFAYDHLSTFLNANIPDITPDDRISFVAHSQGGLVTSIWYAAAALGVDKDGDFNSEVAFKIRKDQRYSDLTEQIITLGTPFWGSKLATYLNDKERLQIQKIPGLSFFFNLGEKELNEMNFLSNTIYSFRQTAIALSHNPKYASIRTPEFIQIAGVYPRDEKKLFYSEDKIKLDDYVKSSRAAVHFVAQYFGRNGFSSEKINSTESDRPESDIAVIVPSSRSEFIYASRHLTCSTVQTPFNSFKNAYVFKNPKYYLTEAIHSPIISESSVGIASVPEFCITPEKCKHPTYRILLKSLAKCEKFGCDSKAYQNIIQQQYALNSGDELESTQLSNGADLQGFSLEINLKVPPSYDLPVRYYYSRNNSENDTNDQIWVLKQKDIFKKLIQPRMDLVPFDQNEVFEIKSARENEIYSSLVQWKTLTFRKMNSTHLRIQLTGLLKPRFASLSLEQAQIYNTIIKEGADFPFEVQLPQYLDYKPKSHLVRAQIRPGYSTFLELDYRNAMNCSE